MTDYKKILVAVDFSDAVDAVIKRAVDVAKRNHTHFTLLHVLEYVPPMDVSYESAMTSSWAVDEEALLKRAKDGLNELCEKHKLKEVTPVVVVGGAKYEICSYAREHKSDLIILGAHGRHGIRLLLGSTANGVLHEMPCDVLAVKVAE